MKFILPDFIVRHELGPVGGAFSLESIFEAARKVSCGLGVSIGKAPARARFFKIALTSKGGAGRVLFMMRDHKGCIIPLLIRTKKDKVGKNMSPKNVFFREAIKKNLMKIQKDIKNGEYETLDLEN